MPFIDRLLIVHNQQKVAVENYAADIRISNETCDSVQIQLA